MSKRDVLAMSFKLLGVYSVMSAIQSVPAIGWAIDMVAHGRAQQDISPFVFLAGALLSPILSLAMACILLKGGDLIAQRLVREDAQISPPGALQWEKPVFVLAMKIVGVVCLAMSIPELGNFVVRLGLSWSQPSAYQTFVHLISPVLLLAVGIYFLLGGKHVVQLACRQK